MRLLWALDHALQRRSKRMAISNGITGPQRLALRVMEQLGEVSAKDLADAMRIHPSTLTGVVARLQRRRLITRRINSADRRRVRLLLTAAGRNAATLTPDTVEHAVAVVLRRTGARRRLAVEQFLADVTAALELPRPSASGPI